MFCSRHGYSFDYVNLAFMNQKLSLFLSLKVLDSPIIQSMRFFKSRMQITDYITNTKSCVFCVCVFCLYLVKYIRQAKI